MDELRIYFLMEVQKCLKEGMEVIYVDETSVSKWDRKVKTWMRPSNPIEFKLQPIRDKGITVIGALSSKAKIWYEFAKSTNSHEFRNFCILLEPLIEKNNTVMVMDNHSAHKGNTVKLLNRMGIRVLFLPPYR
jgi:hypothetical protein